jgi:hypothetical protein
VSASPIRLKAANSSKISVLFEAKLSFQVESTSYHTLVCGGGEAIFSNDFLGTDFCESYGVTIDFPGQCNSQWKVLVFRFPLQRKDKRRVDLLPAVSIGAGHELDVTDPACFVSHTAFVTDREHVCAHSALKVASEEYQPS